MGPGRRNSAARQVGADVRRSTFRVQRSTFSAGFLLWEVLIASAVFAIAVTGLAVATLVARGRLDLDQPIARYIGAALKRYGPPADARVVDATVRQTMIHMAGFTSNERGDDPTILGRDGFVPPKGREREPRSWRKEDVLPAILKRKLEAAPGTSYVYSNAGYVVLGLVVEAASGMNYEEYCREAVFKPAGLLAQGDASGAPNLLDLCRAWVAGHYAKPGRAFLGLVQVGTALGFLGLFALTFLVFKRRFPSLAVPKR